MMVGIQEVDASGEKKRGAAAVEEAACFTAKG